MFGMYPSILDSCRSYFDFNKSNKLSTVPPYHPNQPGLVAIL